MCKYFIFFVLCLQNPVYIVPLLRILILIIKFLTTPCQVMAPMLDSIALAIVIWYLVAWGNQQVMGYLVSCQGDSVLSCNKHYLDVLTLFKTPKSNGTSATNLHQTCVTRWKKRIVSNQCCTAVLLHSGFQLLLQSVCTVCCACSILLCKVVILQLCCAQRSTLRRRETRHTIIVAILKQEKKKPKGYVSLFITPKQQATISNILYLHFLILL